MAFGETDGSKPSCIYLKERSQKDKLREGFNF